MTISHGEVEVGEEGGGLLLLLLRVGWRVGRVGNGRDWRGSGSDGGDRVGRGVDGHVDGVRRTDRFDGWRGERRAGRSFVFDGR